MNTFSSSVIIMLMADSQLDLSESFLNLNGLYILSDSYIN